MSKLSFAEKLGILFNLSKGSILYLIILVALIVAGITYSKSNKLTEKKTKQVYASISLIILLIILLMYHSSLGKLFGYMMDNFFIVVNFPNIAIYFFAIIITNIILWISIFNYKTSKYIKNLNIAVYVIMNYLLILLLNVINEKNLDIFTQKSIYTNKQATALIELSATIFITWIIFLVIYKVLLIYLRKDYKPKVKKIIIRRKVKKLPENYEPITPPDFIYGNAPKRKQEVVEKPTLNTDTSLYDSMLTIEDYKKVLKLLESEKEKRKKEQVIRKQLEEEQTKYEDLLKKQKDNEKAKYEELLDIYR